MQLVSAFSRMTWNILDGTPHYARFWLSKHLERATGPSHGQGRVKDCTAKVSQVLGLSKEATYISTAPEEENKGQTCVQAHNVPVATHQQGACVYLSCTSSGWAMPRQQNTARRIDKRWGRNPSPKAPRCWAPEQKALGILLRKVIVIEASASKVRNAISQGKQTTGPRSPRLMSCASADRQVIVCRRGDKIVNSLRR